MAMSLLLLVLLHSRVASTTSTTFNYTTAPHKPIRLPEGDYCITYLGAALQQPSRRTRGRSKYQGFSLSAYGRDNLQLRDDQMMIWRLYYPEFHRDAFVLQNVWRSGTTPYLANPFSGYYIQIFDRTLDLVAGGPSLWFAYEHSSGIISTFPHSFYLKSVDINSPHVWLGRTKHTHLGMKTFRKPQDLFYFHRLD